MHTPEQLISNTLEHLTERELEVWIAGYLAGWERAIDPLNLEWVDHSDRYREALRRSEAAGRRQAWDAAVLRGENPTPFKPEENS